MGWTLQEGTTIFLVLFQNKVCPKPIQAKWLAKRATIFNCAERLRTGDRWVTRSRSGWEFEGTQVTWQQCTSVRNSPDLD